MKIVRIAIKNFLSIGDAEISPGKINQIVGGNNQGKTTVLRAIETALKGSSDGSLVKHGENQAEIIIEFDNEIMVRRRLKPDGSQTVTVKKGEFEAKGPQGFLSNLVAQGTFNPLDVLDPKVRTEALLKVIPISVTEADLKALVGDDQLPPLDYTQHGLKVVEQVHRYLYQRRAEANKDAKAKADFYRVKYNELPEFPEDPTETMEELQQKVAENRLQVQQEQQKIGAYNEQKKVLDRAMRSVAEALQRRDNLTLEIEQLSERIISLKEDVARISADALRVTPSQEAQAKLTNEGYELNKKVAQKIEYKTHLDRVKTVEHFMAQATAADAFAKHLDALVSKVGSSFKNELMQKAELPIEGLTYQDGQFFLDGHSIDNLSQSMAMRLGVALARKSAGELKLICIDGAEALDGTSFGALHEEISKDDFTYFITKVGDAFTGTTDKLIPMSGGQVAS